MKQVMEHNNYEDLVAFISGILGTILAINLAGIEWEAVWANVGDLLWLGMVAAFSGAMGVLGKHFIGKLIKKFSKNKKQ